MASQHQQESTDATLTDGQAVSLPPRQKTNARPIWSLDGSSPEVPLSAKCDVHDRERVVCCRDLKGSDERSLIDPDIVRDVIIGLADGLTVPFALTAGLSSLGSSRLVYVAGVAELVSGALSMGVGGYLSAQAERDHYRYLRTSTRERVLRSCSGELERETAAILGPLGVEDSISRRVATSLIKLEQTLPAPAPPPGILRQILTAIARKPRFSNTDERSHLLPTKVPEDGDEKGMTAFILKFGEGLEEVSDSRLFISAITIGASYFIGGLIPLLPYFFVDTAYVALWYSIAITTVVLLLFGGFKTYYTGAAIGFRGYAYGCISTLAVGGAAAGASFAIVRALEGKDGGNLTI